MSDEERTANLPDFHFKGRDYVQESGSEKETESESEKSESESESESEEKSSDDTSSD